VKCGNCGESFGMSITDSFKQLEYSPQGEVFLCRITIGRCKYCDILSFEEVRVKILEAKEENKDGQ